MLSLVLIIISFVIFISSFIMVLIDLFSSKGDESQKPILKLPKLSGYGFFFTFFALFLLVIVGFGYVNLN